MQHQDEHHSHHSSSILQTHPFPHTCTANCPYPHTHTHSLAPSHPSPADSAGGGVAAGGSPSSRGGPGTPAGAGGDNSAPGATAPQPLLSYPDGIGQASLSSKRKVPHPDDADGGADGGGGGDGVGGKQTRSKRNRYIAIACNECKRRKIKCNGETPCQRCGNLKLECLYAPNCCSNSFRDSDEFKAMSTHMARLQDQVDGLSRAMTELRSNGGPRLAPLRPDDRISPAMASVSNHSPTPPPSSTLSSPSPMIMAHHQPALSKQPYRGPASTGFSLDIAKRTMHSMGYNSVEDSQESQTQLQPQPQPQPHSHSGAPPSDANDAILEYSLEEIIRLLRFYDDEIGIMYPFLDIEPLMSYARSVYPILVDTARRGGTPTPRTPDPYTNIQTLKMKMVMCCSIAVEAAGQTNKAERIFATIEDRINRILMSDPSDQSVLLLMSLVAGYRWFSNDEILGWRTIGHLMRMCQELGLHTLAGLQRVPEGKERTEALGTFWTLYTLDRRWAFATGLPYVMQDSEIDPSLPLPEKFPYLNAMVTYSRVAAKIWRYVTNLEPVLARDLRQDDIESLDREILQWYEANVPEEVKVRNWDKEKATLTPSYNLKRLRLWTYLRCNQIRIWLYTPILHSATSIMTHPTYAQRVVEMARDTIRYLAHVNATTKIYRRMQLFYHQFLTSAIAVLFLASVHAPVRFSSVCRDEFYVALELVKDLSSKSWVSQRLWKAIGSLKEAAPRFGMRQDDVPSTHVSLQGNSGMQQQKHGRQQSIQGTNVGVLSPPPPQPPLGPGMHHLHQQMSPSHLGSMSHPMNPAPAPTDMTMDGAVSVTQGQSPVGTPPNGLLLQTEMSKMFEGYVNFTGDGLDMMAGGSGGMGAGEGAPMGMLSGGDEMFQIFRDLY